MILVQKNSNRKIKYIDLQLEGDTVYRTWGLVSGKSQLTNNKYDYINKGKKNQKSPEKVAKEDYLRIAKEKKKEGYIEIEDLNNIPDLPDAEEINFENLQTTFCCSKPVQKISEEKLQELIDSGNAELFIKYNGLCHYIMITGSGEVKIYTRRLDDHTVKYPEIVKYVEQQRYPVNSIFIVELLIDPLMESFSLISSISKSNVLKGVPKEDLSKNFALQAKNEVRACVFGILYYNGGELWERPYVENLDLMDDLFDSVAFHTKLFKPTKVFLNSAEEYLQYIIDRKFEIEGLVAWDTSKHMEITFNGKPKRRAAWKILVKGNVDILAIGGNEGTGDRQGKIGSLQIGIYNDDNEIEYLQDCGSGIKDDECDWGDWEFPCVIAMEFGQRFPSGKYQFPVFLKKHEDKLPGDFVNGL